MTSIAKQLQEHTKDTKSLRAFLDFLIKNKIYDSSLYLENLKDFDNNNLLLKACIYRLHNQVEQLLPHLDASIFSYKNNNGVSLAHQYYIDTSLSSEQNLKTINLLAQASPASFAFSPASFSPWSSTPDYERLARDIDAQKFKICLLFCKSQPQKLTQLLSPKIALQYIYHHGLKSFNSDIYSTTPNLINYFFHSFCEVMTKPISSTFENFAIGDKVIDCKKEIEASRKDFEQIVLKYAHTSRYKDSGEHNLSLYLFSSNFLSSIATSYDNSSAAMQVFNSLAFNNKAWLQTLDFNTVGSDKNSLIHIFVNAIPEAALADPQVAMFFDTILSNCHHLNTKNNLGLDPYDFALKLGKPNFSQHIKTFIEKKIITSLVPEVKKNNIDETPIQIIKKSNKI